jgi:hypothetical protein
MSGIERWFSEDPRRTPAEIACSLAGDRFWRDEHQSVVGTHPEMPDAACLLALDEELAHALLLVLSRLPAGQRLEFAQAFYDRVPGGPPPVPRSSDAPRRLALGASIVLFVVELIDLTPNERETVTDLLQGAAQGDDLERTPPTTVAQLARTITRLRSEQFVDDSSKSGVAGMALAEVLAPSSGAVDVQEVLARCTSAALDNWDRERVLSFLVDVRRLLSGR